MKIAVLGAGAMGSLYGAMLSRTPENEVVLLDIWKEHINAINSNGLLVEYDENVTAFNRLKACSDSSRVGRCDLVIIFVKSTMTKEAIKENLALFGPGTVAITLQNGLGNVEAIKEMIGEGNIIPGTTAHGATMLSPGKIRHAGKGKTIIGELSGGETNRIAAIKEMFDSAGLKTEISNNVIGLIWDKLLVNAGINALTGLTGLHNGELLIYPELIRIMEAVVTEAALIAKKKGINLLHRDPVVHTKDVCRATSANRSSMLQDIISGKETEIKMINGAIVKMAHSIGMSAPVNETLTNLILFKQGYKGEL